MSDLELVLQSIDKLTAEEKLRVVAYILDTSKPSNSQISEPRILDLHPGAFEMSDDFTDELRDSFWLGEDD